MSSKSKSGKPKADARASRPPDPHTREQVVMAEDFRRLQHKFHKSLKSAQRDAEDFAANISSYRSGSVWSSAYGEFCHNLKRRGMSLNDVLAEPDRAVRMYIECGATKFHGGKHRLDAAILLVRAVQGGLLNMKGESLTTIEHAIRPFVPKADRYKLMAFWQESAVPLLKNVDPKRFQGKRRDAWTPMREEIIACGLLANLIEAPASDPHAPYATARWFNDEFGISADSLQGHKKRGNLHTKKRDRWNLYSVPDAMRIWPELVTYRPCDSE